MDYMICNNRRVYIRLAENGRPETCGERDRGRFEYSKARNIVDNLPKILKKMNFKVEAIPDIKLKKTEITIKNTTAELSANVTRWIEKFGSCEDVLREAKERYDFLKEKIHLVDNDILNILHQIELENPKDMYHGWLLDKKLREDRTKRREMKDELLIIDNVLRQIDPSSVSRANTQKAIDGLFDRKYTFRIVEDEEE